MTELEEVKALKNLLGTLFGKSKSGTAKSQNVSPSEVETHAREIIKKVIADVGADVLATERKKTTDGVTIRYRIEAGSRKFWLKIYVVYESRYFNMTIWSADRQNLLDVLAIGDLRQSYRLRSMARIRLEPWAKGAK